MNTPKRPSPPHPLTPSPPHVWRSLDEFEQSPEFLNAVEGEFPGVLALWNDEASRRSFLQRMGASFALAGVAGCVRQPEEPIVPPVETREHNVPGRTRQFATSMPVPGGAIGLLVQSRDGRPIKIEGNPDHPASLGATDVFAQAEILNLYDPDRSHVVRRGAAISNWADFAAELNARVDEHRGARGKMSAGAGLHLLTGSITSPTLLNLLKQVLDELPGATWHQYEPFDASNVRAGTKRAFDRELSPRYHVHKADVIFSLDADFLNEGPAKLRLSREFARGRRVTASGKGTMNRLYVAECTPTLTGAAADHRLPLSPAQLGRLLQAVAGKLGVENGDVNAPAGDVPAEWLSALVADLKRAGKRALVMVGESQPPAVQALSYAINARLNSLGQTVEFVPPPGAIDGHQPKSLADLVASMQQETVKTLVVLDANPVQTAPGNEDFKALLRKVPFTAHLGLYRDETAWSCRWHIPALHFLESWGDARAEDGTAGIIQPLISPLFNGKSAIEVFNVMLGKPNRTAQQTVRTFWQEKLGTDGFDHRWNKALHDGLIEKTAFESADVSLDAAQIEKWKGDGNEPGDPGALTIVFRPDPTIHDSRYANNGWLQELPKPFSKLTWTNAALLSPATAQDRKVRSGDVVQLTTGDRTISIPVFIVPGHPDEVVTLHTGYGRKHAGRNGDGNGVNVTPLQTLKSPWFGSAVLQSTGQRVDLPTTQNHYLMENRRLVRAGTLETFQKSPKHPEFMQTGGHHEGPPASLYPEPPVVPPSQGRKEEELPQWGMSINLGACIGCNACVVACQSENNIPIVGPEEVRRGREMHWIRVDTYYEGDAANPQTHHQPVPCMHCEHAPCEPVCPVAATTHSDEGLNEMTYNRCIGTRYCSNNCPYKVRRFNFLDYREDVKDSPVLQLLQNPEVSVRSRGVMEKCTYCVQRISHARIQAKIEDRDIKDGDVVTACQAVCPTEAIVFGDIADPNSAVSKQKSHPLNYGLLEDLNTRPRTTYLAAVRNPDSRLADDEA